jgi:hypothetical protein
MFVKNDFFKEYVWSFFWLESTGNGPFNRNKRKNDQFIGRIILLNELIKICEKNKKMLKKMMKK